MNEKLTLLTSIAKTAADYRQGDLAAPSPEHVDRWVQQFNAEVQIPILREMDHVLKKTYFSRKDTINFLKALLQNKELVGDNPCNFWKNLTFLDIQNGGASQKEMLAFFSKLLKSECGFGVDECGADQQTYVYLDDAIFTGNRVRRDLEAWIAQAAPSNAHVHIIVIAHHTGGTFYADKRIRDAACRVGKTISLTWWRAIELEDRRNNTPSSDVLRPVSIPNDAAVNAYVAAMQRKPHLRIAGQIGTNKIFSSDAGRQLLEQEFLKAGVHIRNMCQNLGETQRPLGHMTLETLGFGSLIVTFRNCPNNAPLALWVGDPWYPLFPRTTNSETSLKNFMAMLAKDVF